jgi:hypothetical protein
MASKWRILLKSIETSPMVADTIIQAICVLYNFDIDESRQFRPEQLADHGDEDNGVWRNAAGGAVQQFVQMRPARANNPTNEAKRIRNRLKTYFCGVGAVAWQERAIQRFNF